MDAARRMRVFFIAAMLAMLAAPAASADPLAGMCDEGDPVGDALHQHTGDCGGTIEPWQCLGGASGSKTYHVGPYHVVINQCDAGLPDLW